MPYQPGDHLKVRRLGGIYTHHGIYVGGGQVIHYTGEPTRFWDAEIERASVAEFADGGTVAHVPPPAGAFPPADVVARAESRLAERAYVLLFNNCEHFATWCQTGRAQSDQADRAVAAGANVVGLPPSILRALLGLSGTLDERFAGAGSWRDALMNGTLPPPGTWPGVAVDAPLRLAARRLNVTGYFDGQPELVDEFLGDALRAFGRGEQELKQHLGQTLARHVEAHLRRTLTAQLNALAYDMLGPEMHAVVQRAMPLVGDVLDRIQQGVSSQNALAEVGGDAIGRKLADVVRPKIAEFVNTTVAAFVELQREVGAMLPDGFLGEVLGSVLNTVSRLALSAMQNALSLAIAKYAATTPTTIISTVLAAVFAPVLDEVVRGSSDLLQRLNDTIPLGPLDTLLSVLLRHKRGGLCSSPDTPGKVANALAKAIDGSGSSGQWLRDAADAFDRQREDSGEDGEETWDQAFHDALGPPSDVPQAGYSFDMDVGHLGGDGPPPPQPPEFGAAAIRMATEYATAELAAGERAADTEVVEQWEERVEAWRALEEMFGELGALLGDRLLGRSMLRHVGFREMRKLSDLLKKRGDLVALVRSIGQLRQHDGDGVSLAEEIMQPMRRAGERQVRTPLVAADVRGITFGGEISRMLPSEAALLPHPMLKMLWHARRAEQALLLYQVDGTEAEVREEDSAVPDQSHNLVRGPIIAVVDTSGSMYGKPERFAKAVILEAMRTAHAERRACLVFAFSGDDEVRELELDLSSEGLSSLLEFLSWSFDGWTEIGGVTRRVLARLSEESWSNADVMIVTDGEFDVSRSLAANVAAQRERGTRFHGVLLGHEASSLRRLCDHLHITSMRTR